MERKESKEGSFLPISFHFCFWLLKLENLNRRGGFCVILWVVMGCWYIYEMHDCGINDKVYGDILTYPTYKTYLVLCYWWYNTSMYCSCFYIGLFFFFFWGSLVFWVEYRRKGHFPQNNSNMVAQGGVGRNLPALGHDSPLLLYWLYFKYT